MPNNKVELELGTQQAQSALSAMQAEADRLLATLKEIASSLGSGAAGDPTFQSTARSYAAAQGAVTAASSVSGTASTVGSGGGAAAISAAMVSGAKQGAAAFGQIPQGMGPAATIAAAQAAGAGVQYTVPFNAAAFVGGVLGGPSTATATAASAGPSRVFMASGAGGAPPWIMAGGPAPVGPGGPGLPGGNGPWPVGIGTSMAGPFGGWGAGSNAMDWMTQFATYRHSRAMVAGLGIPMAEAIAVSAGERVSGHIDILGRGRATGSLIGGAIGMATGNPWVAMGAAAIGGQVGGWLAAPMEQTSQIAAGLGMLQGLNPGQFRAGFAWSRGLSGQINEALDSNIRSVSPQAIASAGASAYSGLTTGGLDPMGRRIGPAPRLLNDGSTGSLVRNMARLSQYEITSALGGEPLYQAVTRRIATLYPNDEAMGDVMNRIAPIWGSTPETGGSVADILRRFGAVGTYQYLQSRVEPGVVTDVPLRELASSSAAYRGGARQAELGAAQVRGSGSAMEAAYRSQMSTVAGLPGGEQSVTFAEARTHARSAAMLGFEQMSAVEFGVPAARLEAARAISMVSPYGPGNRFGIEALAVQNARGQLARVRAFAADRRSRGELSEEDELSLTQQEASLSVQIAQGMATMTEGVADRLPSLMAGRPAAFGRADSSTLASLNFMRIGHPRRGVGAVSGGQLRMQDDFLRNMGMGPGDVAPRSRYSDINNPRVEALLERIATAIEKGQLGSTPRPGELRGAVASSLSGKAVYPSADRGW